MNKQKNSEVKFDRSLPLFIAVTVFTWTPFMLVIVPVITYGEISENSLGSGGRIDRSPFAYFLIMSSISALFAIISFFPMVESYFRGYYIKFDNEYIHYRGKKYPIDGLIEIKCQRLFGNNFRFCMKNGKNFFINSGVNDSLSKYIEKRFSYMLH